MYLILFYCCISNCSHVLMHIKVEKLHGKTPPPPPPLKKNDKLREVQLQKKCLVIIDDIWDFETWNSLRDAFPLKNTGSKILLTSRNKQASLHVDTESSLYELQTLNKERSWELLEKIAISRIKGIRSNFLLW